MKGKLYNKDDTFYGDLGEKTFIEDGIQYFIGDVVEVFDSRDCRTDTTIIIKSCNEYLPMWYSNINFVRRYGYKLNRIKNWYDLKDKESFCEGTIRVEIEDAEQKPPLGLEPKEIWKLQRLQDIVAAINRYFDGSKEIPVKWVEEYNELAKELALEE